MLEHRRKEMLANEEQAAATRRLGPLLASRSRFRSDELLLMGALAFARTVRLTDE
jgi:hypothetical protein